ncbi:hypothetical protein [Streptomyces liangshanensis]|uniref:Secreted protein n=1 Tax=Streptomyces liangshanensis TaxID=2717324 RepID=A0A6G9H511_9ACTN|nr:hypothetical protein [Streptomyces liangshanensis]QIQ05612.1 hypothetical protein HA039_27900 [Streptomyces liangshanensis]
MQLSDVPDLAHTRPRPMHWLATATAMAGVVAVAGLVQPGPATASQDSSGPTTTAAPGHAPGPAPDPAGVTFPLDCADAGTVVTQKASGDLDGDGNPETVAAVRCVAGSGTPPSGLYVLTRAGKDTTRARIVATLVDPKEKQSLSPGLAVRDGAVTATLLGYSNPDVPRCCPDEKQQVTWKWRNGAFVRGTGPGSQSV